MILNFLRDLRKNNNRVYFNENKDAYLAAKKAFEEIVGGLINEVLVFDSGVKYLAPQDCIFRIYRDVRFSPNKQTALQDSFRGLHSSARRPQERAGRVLHTSGAG